MRHSESVFSAILLSCAAAFPMTSAFAEDSASFAGVKPVYGADDRLDVFEVADPLQLALSASVCLAIPDARLFLVADEFLLVTTPYSFTDEDNNIFPPCFDEPFRDQPTSAFCTAFLVGEDLVVSAGHCDDALSMVGTRFVFGFDMTDAETAVTSFTADQVYQGVEIVAQSFSQQSIDLQTFDVPDYVVVRLDRPVTAPGAVPLEVRRSGSVAVGTQIGVIGHPFGLPKKIAFGNATTVRESVDTEVMFITNLDTYAGNSGSPVFNAATGVVEGVLSLGVPDLFSVDSNSDGADDCFNSNSFLDDQGFELATKITELAAFIPPLQVGEGEGEGEGEGDGEGEGPVCAASTDGPPGVLGGIEKALGDLVLLTLAAGALLFHRRRILNPA